MVPGTREARSLAICSAFPVADPYSMKRGDVDMIIFKAKVVLTVDFKNGASLCFATDINQPNCKLVALK
jgi:hypothetical protein